MQEIVNNGVLISDSFPAGEASDLFIENLKENVDVCYDGKHKRVNEFPMQIRLENQSINVIYIYKKKDEQLLKHILNKYTDSIEIKKESYHFNTVSNKDDLKDFFADRDFFKIFEGLKKYEKEIAVDPITDY